MNKRFCFGVFLFLKIFSCPAQEIKIEKNFKFISEPVYVCHDSLEVFGMEVGRLSILNSDTLKIENLTNTGYSGEAIDILISKNLKIVRVSYRKWIDFDDGSQTIYEVEEPLIVLSANPFIHGIKGLKGKYKFTIRTTTDFKISTSVFQANFEYR